MGGLADKCLDYLTELSMHMETDGLFYTGIPITEASVNHSNAIIRSNLEITCTCTCTCRSTCCSCNYQNMTGCR